MNLHGMCKKYGSDNKKTKIIKGLLQAISVLCLAFCAAFCVWAYKKRLFSSPEALQEFISGYGATGRILFVLFQILQVVIPILSGGVSLVAGVVLFGPVEGFIYNYIGIVIGSVIGFAIARELGKPVLNLLFSKETLDKYDRWTTQKHRFEKLLAWALFLPGLPDDLLCFLAGTTQMKFSTFLRILLITKPLVILFYSLGFVGFYDQFIALLR